MLLKQTPEILSLVFAIIFFAIIMVLILSIAKFKGFFTYSHTHLRKVSINHKMLFAGLFTYFLINTMITPTALKLLSSFFNLINIPSTSKDILNLSLINIFNNVLITLSLLFVSLIFFKDQLKNIWKENSVLKFFSYWEDIKVAIVSWCIALPAVMLTSNLSELFLKIFFKNQPTPDQVAIEYVKMASVNITHFLIALISVLLFAPFIEEFLFRGLLQNYLRKYFGINKSIILASTIFALLHFTLSQGLSNVTIILSLFVLSLFLGFIYEKQKSLLSPIVLHALFNATNIFNLLFFKDT